MASGDRISYLGIRLRNIATSVRCGTVPAQPTVLAQRKVLA
jgi:hypothetical protein